MAQLHLAAVKAQVKKKSRQIFISIYVVGNQHPIEAMLSDFFRQIFISTYVFVMWNQSGL